MHPYLENWWQSGMRSFIMPRMPIGQKLNVGTVGSKHAEACEKVARDRGLGGSFPLGTPVSSPT